MYKLIRNTAIGVSLLLITVPAMAYTCGDAASLAGYFGGGAGAGTFVLCEALSELAWQAGCAYGGGC